ncbi:hypothetical protein AGMMS49940_08420 [Spirochaetia bacterium]|nr:hypothetical protein AGMMS49940_08420 [Spirochaetia bacterium]
MLSVDTKMQAKEVVWGNSEILGFFEVVDESEGAGLCGGLTFWVPELGEGRGQVLEALSLPFCTDAGRNPG